MPPHAAVPARHPRRRESKVGSIGRAGDGEGGATDLVDYIQTNFSGDHLDRIESPVLRASRESALPDWAMLQGPLRARRGGDEGVPLATRAADADDGEDEGKDEDEDEGGHSRDRLFQLALGAAGPGRSLRDRATAAIVDALSPPAGSNGAPASKLLCWDFDVVHLESALGPATLPVMALAYLRSVPALASVDEAAFVRFMAKMASSYRSLPYHTATHAADTLQALVYFMYQPEPPAADGPPCPTGCPWRLTPPELLGALVGAAVHDVDHTGQNNAFHVAVGSDLAITYNDQSVLENHHCAVAFRALRRADLNFCGRLGAAERRDFRETLISIVLGTDMAKHFEHVNQLKATTDSGVPINWAEARDRRFVLQAALHAADVSNACRPQRLAVEWASRCADARATLCGGATAAC